MRTIFIKNYITYLNLAACPALAAEWLGVLQTLCSPSSSRHSPLYADILSAVDVKHLSIHSSLATLTSLLVARQCFSLEDFVKQAVFSLLKAWNEGGYNFGKIVQKNRLRFNILFNSRPRSRVRSGHGSRCETDLSIAPQPVQDAGGWQHFKLVVLLLLQHT